MKSLRKLKKELQYANKELRKSHTPQLHFALLIIRDTLRFVLDESDISPVYHVLALANFSDGLKSKTKKSVSKFIS